MSKTYIPIIALVLLFSSCSYLPNKSSNNLFFEIKNSPRQFIDEDIQRDSNAYYNYVLGELAEKDQDFSAASSFYKKAAVNEVDAGSQVALKSKLAEIYVKENKLDMALSECESILELDPKNVNIMFLNARILEMKKDYDSAKVAYQKISDSYPSRIESYVLRSNLFLREKNYSKANYALESYLESNSENSLIYFYLARVAQSSRDLEKAEKYYLKSFSLDSRQENTIRALLEFYLSQEKGKEAEEVARKVIRDNPNNLLARRVLGELLVVAGRYDEALEHLQVLESYQSNPNETRIKIALIQIEKQDFIQAEKELKFVLGTDSENALARYYLAMAYAGQDRIDDATRELLSISKDETYYIKARTFAYFLFRQKGDLPSAADCIGAAYLNNVGSEKLFSYYVSTLRDIEKLEEALSVTRLALGRDSKSATFLYTEGVLLSDLNREEEAVESMEKVLQIDSNNSEALNFIAYSLAEREVELARAERLIVDALNIKPNDFYYRDTYAWILLKLGRLEEARSQLSAIVNDGASDTVILEHYADVLTSLGMNREAIKVHGRILEELSSDILTSKQIEQIDRIKRKISDLN